MEEYNRDRLDRIRCICTTDELAKELYRILSTWFYKSWEELVSQLKDGEITSSHDLQEWWLDQL